MSSTLTDYLMNIKDNLTKLKEIRNYLDSNSDSQFSVTWQTIEAFNFILTNCNISESTDVRALSTLLDSFRCMATNNNQDNNIWNNFEFEMGIISMKILSAIEQSSMFEVLFHKFLSVISIICDTHSELWKGVARQILNIFINKNFSFDHLETGLQIYMSILKKIKSSALLNFAQQNLHLLRTFSLKIQYLGDFEIQCYVVEVIFLHFPKNKDLIQNFFVEDNSQLRNIFEKLDFDDFEESTRIYLNALNKSLGTRRRVFSVNCITLYVGNHDLGRLTNERLIQLNANDMSQRLSTKFTNFSSHSSSFCVINIPFSDLKTAEIERQPENRLRLIIKSNNLRKIDPSVTADKIVCLLAEDDNPDGEVFKFKDFLEKSIAKGKQQKKKNEQFEKLSQTSNVISIDRSVEGKEELTIVPWNHDENDSGGKNNHGLSRIIPQALDLISDLENHKAVQLTEANVCEEGEIRRKENNTSDNFKYITSKYFNVEEEKISFAQKPDSSASFTHIKTPERESKNIPENQELTPNSFAKSLNENLGLNSPDPVQSFEETLDPSPFEHNNSEKVNRKLFQNSHTIFTVLNGDIDDNEKSFFEELKSNREIEKKLNLFFDRDKLNSSKKKLSAPSAPSTTENNRNEEFDSQIDALTFSKKTKKPSLPKIFEKSKKVKNADKKKNKKEDDINTVEKNDNLKKSQTQRPSLLDPNGYAYRRWLQPTTSERSNFWLNKLTASSHKKASESHVYEFSEDVDPEQKSKSQKKRGRKNVKKLGNICCKRNEKMNRSNVSFQQYKKLMLRHEKLKTPVIKKKVEMEEAKKAEEFDYPEENSSPKNPATDFLFPQTEEEPFPVSFKNLDKEFDQRYDNLIAGRSSSCESIFEEVNSCENNCEVENGAKANNQLEAEVQKNNFDVMESECFTTISINSAKRKRSEDENSLVKNVRRKNAFIPFWFQVRLQKFQEKYKRETNEIVEAFSKANANILSRIYEQQVKDVVSYLKQAEAMGKCLTSEGEFKIRKERIKKLILYFRIGCTLTELTQTTENTCEKIRKAFNSNLRIATTGRYSNKITSLNQSLKTLIDKQIEEHLRQETVTNRSRLLQYATMFNTKFKGT